MSSFLETTINPGESEPLLNSTSRTPHRPKPRHYLIAVFLFMNSFALQLYGLFITQYIYKRTEVELFPYSTFNGSYASICTMNKSMQIFHERTRVQQETSRWFMYKSLAEAAPSAIMSCILVSLSDKYGRKTVLAVNLAFVAVGMGLTAVGVGCSVDDNYFILFACVSSMAGGIYGAISLGFAYISDITEAGNARVLFITLLDASLGLGLTMSGLVSGHLIDYIGYQNTSICSFVILVCAVPLVLCFLPETLPRGTNSANTTTATTTTNNNNNNAASPFNNMATTGVFVVSMLYDTLRAAFGFYFRKSSDRSKYVLFLFIFIMACFSRLGKISIEILYTLNAPFCWSHVLVGYFVALSDASSMIIGIAAIKLLQKICGDITIAILSSISNASSCVLEAFAYNDLTLFTVPVIALLGVLAIPMMRAVLSKMTPTNKQGSLFAGMAAVEICVSLIAHVGYKAIYIYTIESFRGATFLVFCAFSVVVMGLLLAYRCYGISRGYAHLEAETTCPSETSERVEKS